MYQLHLTVHETIGAYVCSTVVSDVAQSGQVTQVAKSVPRYLEVDPRLVEDEFAGLLDALARYVRIMTDSP